jgi:Holliday junction resolvase
MASLHVINSRGEKEPFSFEKVYKSAKRVGASPELAREIAETLQREVFPGIKTSVIYKRIHKLLSQSLPVSALKFSLKQGMRKLGPTGFPFEKYVGAVLKGHGFKVRINQFLSGFCLKDYEIDFVAEKNGLVYVGECKYRNLPGDRVASGDVLKNHARFLDILKGPYFRSKKYQGYQIKTMMVTNTKFTDRAKNYSRCAGVELLGWRHPKDRGLEYLIEKEKLYPVTILPSLRGYLKNIFVSRKIMLAKDILKIDSQRFAKKFNVKIKLVESLVREAEALLKE